jgi:hypothetical protein
LRSLTILAILLGGSLLAGAEKRSPVAQVEDALSKMSIAHKSDSEVLHRIGNIELSERLSELTVDRLIKGLTLNDRVAQALHLLADQSAFLDLPTSELPVIALPDAAAKQQMLDAARSFVVQTLPRLPDILATRTTERFDDSAEELTPNAWPIRAGQHLVGSSSSEISVRNDRDTRLSTARPAVKDAEAESGLTSWGEFGPILAMILEDTFQRQGQLAPLGKCRGRHGRCLQLFCTEILFASPGEWFSPTAIWTGRIQQH